MRAHQFFTNKPTECGTWIATAHQQLSDTCASTGFEYFDFVHAADAVRKQLAAKIDGLVVFADPLTVDCGSGNFLQRPVCIGIYVKLEHVQWPGAKFDLRTPSIQQRN